MQFQVDKVDNTKVGIYTLKIIDDNNNYCITMCMTHEELEELGAECSFHL